MAGPRLLGAAEIDQGLADLPEWESDGNALRRTYETAGFPTAVRLVGQVVDDAQDLDHHPDIDIRYDLVHFSLSTHSAGGVTALDVELAHRVEKAAGPLIR